MKVNKIKLSILAIMSLAFVGCGSSGGGHDNHNNSNITFVKNSSPQDTINTGSKTVINADKEEIAFTKSTDNKNISSDPTNVNQNDQHNSIAYKATTGINEATNGFSVRENNSLAILAEKKGTVVNIKDNATFNGHGGIVLEAKHGAVINLETNGTKTNSLNVIGNNTIVAISDGSDAKVINDRIINIGKDGGSGHDDIAMLAKSGGYVENNGTIEFFHGDRVVGMMADGKGSNAVNNGTIILTQKYDEAHKGNAGIGMAAINGGNISNNGTIQMPKNGYNRALSIDKNSTINNHGHIVFK